jgi:hypothetical protein
MKMITKFGVLMIMAVIAVLLASAKSDIDLPLGWRKPTRQEIEQHWRDKDPNRYSVVKTDFNGDGVTDCASLLLREKGQGFGLFVFLSQKDSTFKTYLLEEVKDASYINFMGIAAVSPGIYETLCGKGECRDGDAPSISLQNYAIEYFKKDSASSFFYWDKLTESFKRIWVSD